MLLGQAIELALKVSIAHKLVARGFEYDQLFIRLRRRKYGHNLTHLRKVAAKLGIDVSQMRERVYDHIAYAHQLPHASRYPKPADAFRVPSDSECAEVLRFIEEVALKKRVTG
jgi:hypothetical protein